MVRLWRLATALTVRRSGYNPAWPYLSLPSGVPPPKAMGFVAAQSASEKASEWIGTKLRSGSKRLAYRAAPV